MDSSSPPTIDDTIAAALVPGGANPAPEHAIDDHLGETNGNPVGISLFQLIAEDYRTHDRELFSQGFWAIALCRFGNWRMDIHPRIIRLPFSLIYKVLFKIVEWTCGISLNYTTRVGRRVRIWHHSGMILGARRIGDDCHLRQNTTIGLARRGVQRTDQVPR